MLSTYELLFTLVIAVFLFGSKKIPELAESLGKSINIFRKSMKDIDESTDKMKKEKY